MIAAMVASQSFDGFIRTASRKSTARNLAMSWFAL
jgi:hypothetical protein